MQHRRSPRESTTKREDNLLEIVQAYLNIHINSFAIKSQPKKKKKKLDEQIKGKRFYKNRFHRSSRLQCNGKRKTR